MPRLEAAARNGGVFPVVGRLRLHAPIDGMELARIRFVALTRIPPLTLRNFPARSIPSGGRRLVVHREAAQAVMPRDQAERS